MTDQPFAGLAKHVVNRGYHVRTAIRTRLIVSLGTRTKGVYTVVLAIAEGYYEDTDSACSVAEVGVASSCYLSELDMVAWNEFALQLSDPLIALGHLT